MTDRLVTSVRRNDDGDITALCNAMETWSQREKEDAIDEIEHHQNEYHTMVDGRRAEIHVVHGPNGKYLRTMPDDTPRDDLGSLPECGCDRGA